MLTMLIAFLLAFVPCNDDPVYCKASRVCESQMGRYEWVEHGYRVLCGQSCQFVPTWRHRNFDREGWLSNFARVQLSAELVELPDNFEPPPEPTVECW